MTLLELLRIISSSSSPTPSRTRLRSQWVFYLFSASALLWLPLWYPINTLPPSSSNPWKPLSQQDDVDVDDSSSQTALGKASTSSAVLIDHSKSSPPQLGMMLDKGFWALMKRREVWAICVAQYTGSWGMYGLLNWLPTFFSEYYGVQIADLGSYTLLPYVVQGGLGALSGLLAGEKVVVVAVRHRMTQRAIPKCDPHGFVSPSCPHMFPHDTSFVPAALPSPPPLHGGRGHTAAHSESGKQCRGVGEPSEMLGVARSAPRSPGTRLRPESPDPTHGQGAEALCRHFYETTHLYGSFSCPSHPEHRTIRK